MRCEYYCAEDSHTGLLIVGDSMYEVCRNADMPNGVCIYHGDRGDRDRLDELDFIHGFGEPADVPIGVVRAALNMVIAGLVGDFAGPKR